jgi:hypothetical protein
VAKDRAQQAAQQVAALEQEMQAMHMAQVQQSADWSASDAAACTCMSCENRRHSL